MLDPHNGLLILFRREDAKRLFRARGDEAIIEFLTEHVADLPEGDRVSLEGAWHAVHAGLCGGTGETDGELPLNQTILGGRPLYSAEDRIVRLIRPDMVPHISEKLADLDEVSFNRTLESVDRSELRDRSANPSDDPNSSPAGSVWTIVQRIKQFFDTAKLDQAAVLFWVDLGENRPKER